MKSAGKWMDLESTVSKVKEKNVCSPSCANPNLNCIQEYMLTGGSIGIT